MNLRRAFLAASLLASALPMRAGACEAPGPCGVPVDCDVEDCAPPPAPPPPVVTCGPAGCVARAPDDACGGAGCEPADAGRAPPPAAAEDDRSSRP